MTIVLSRWIISSNLKATSPKWGTFVNVLTKTITVQITKIQNYSWGDFILRPIVWKRWCQFPLPLKAFNHDKTSGLHIHQGGPPHQSSVKFPPEEFLQSHQIFKLTSVLNNALKLLLLLLFFSFLKNFQPIRISLLCHLLIGNEFEGSRIDTVM